MAINRDDVEKRDKENRDLIFGKIRESGLKLNDLTTKIEGNMRAMGEQDININNVCTTVNNKLVELSQTFRRAGISMFSMPYERGDFVSTPLVGNAILNDFVDRIDKACEILEEFNQEMQGIVPKKHTEIQKVGKMWEIKKYGYMLMALFRPVKVVDLSLADEEKAQLKGKLESYRDIDQAIFDYNLERDLIPSLAKYISAPKRIGDYYYGSRYSASDVPKVLQEKVIPYLKALGLEQLVPELQEALIIAYKNNPHRIPGPDEKCEIPDFSETNRNGNEGSTLSVDSILEKLRSYYYSTSTEDRRDIGKDIRMGIKGPLQQTQKEVKETFEQTGR